jgi:hypothetical protein
MEEQKSPTKALSPEEKMKEKKAEKKAEKTEK